MQVLRRDKHKRHLSHRTQKGFDVLRPSARVVTLSDHNSSLYLPSPNPPDQRKWGDSRVGGVKGEWVPSKLQGPLEVGRFMIRWLSVGCVPYFVVRMQCFFIRLVYLLCSLIFRGSVVQKTLTIKIHSPTDPVPLVYTPTKILPQNPPLIVNVVTWNSFRLAGVLHLPGVGQSTSGLILCFCLEGTRRP